MRVRNLLLFAAAYTVLLVCYLSGKLFGSFCVCGRVVPLLYLSYRSTVCVRVCACVCVRYYTFCERDSKHVPFFGRLVLRGGWLGIRCWVLGVGRGASLQHTDPSQAIHIILVG